ncbi:MAG TPA: hypothetical protein VM240_12190 [Verrucomicrobiae bacterium]|nr:hypothetical protein [Verrucomicrobiae bacterium]
MNISDVIAGARMQGDGAAAPALQSGRALPIKAPGSKAAFGSNWDATAGLLTTHLGGEPTRDHIARWEAGLHAALAASAGAPLKILIDLAGYEVADVPWEVHREQREVFPRLLLALGLRPGYFNLIGATPAAGPGIRPRLVAVAHVHHDREKMAHHEAVLGTRNDRYFSDRAAALGWLRDLPARSIP